ncbi:MAG: Zn-dependent hydrolase [Dehalococcoidia bacterium]
MKPNIDRFRRDIEALAQIGRVPEGGVSRFSLSPEDLKGRELVMGLMKEAGLSVRVDAIGNIRARREGQDPPLPLVMMGSHIDSVPNGGDFDGPTGVMGALEVVRTLNDAGVTTCHPIEVVVFTDEEGSRFKQGTLGSAAMGGVHRLEQFWDLVDEEGITFKEALGVIETGGSPDEIALKNGEVRAFLELHVEQSARLEEMGIPIGIVEAITGSSHLRVTVLGKADHAGATPMNRRTDALVPAAQMVQEVERIGRSDPAGSLVGTVGYLAVEPGAMNIVPSRVIFTTDVRDTSPSTLDSAVEEIRSMVVRVAQSRGVQFEIEDLEYTRAVSLSPLVRGAMSEACKKLGIKAVGISSRAVHDTSHIAQVADAGMIFVPSVGGKSHSPAELTHWEDIKPGLDVLHEVILSLAGD